MRMYIYNAKIEQRTGVVREIKLMEIYGCALFAKLNGYIQNNGNINTEIFNLNN